MSQSRIPKQLIDFQRQLVELQKQAFDSSFSAISALQDQQRDIWSRLLENAPAMPAEMKQLMEEWGKALESGRDQFRDTVDRSFDAVESYLDRLGGDGEEIGEKGGGKSGGSAKGRSVKEKE